MKWIDSIITAFNRFTGINARRVKAQRNANDWLETVNQFIKAHAIERDNVDMEKILDKSGDIKFELTTLTYNGREMQGRAGNLMNNAAVELIAEMVDNLDRIRRYMFSPALQKERIRQALIKLHSSAGELYKIFTENKS